MENFDHLENDEKLKAENEFMKMKLMLEKDASFAVNNGTDLPAEIENEFLRNVIEFERQFEKHKTIKVFDKIGRPSHFKPAAEIPDQEIDQAWDELSDYLCENAISLDVCSPNISKRELYRFTLEELFDYEMDDMNIPGMMNGFIYDEFHPDPVYDNTRAAVNDCIAGILRHDPLEWTYQFSEEKLRLNEHSPISVNELKTRVNTFKKAYDNLEIDAIEVDKCIVDADVSIVTGRYNLKVTIDASTELLSGNWTVIFQLWEESNDWSITEIEINGINF